MLALQKTITRPAGRRLRLDLPLPDTVTAGWMEVQVLIQPLPAEPPQPETARKHRHTAREAIDLLRGCCKDSPGTVDEFLAECHADKERELAIERRQAEESARYAELSS
ncbi:MAG: hypothetical protein LBR16_00610 [Treponema sp.]|jgi:hypothetical protein|nr:hypothetical protein [Treponema sp.]